MAIVGLVLFGCVGPPSAKQLENADYGQPISTSDARNLASAWLNQNLKDPDSARIEWGQVYKSWFRDAPAFGGRLYWGYSINAQVNAKNSFGGYTGLKPYRFMFRDGVLEHVWGERSGYGPLGPYTNMMKLQ